jgi:hypothetical protein
MTRKRVVQVFEACKYLPCPVFLNTKLIEIFRKLLKQVPPNANYKTSSIVFESLNGSNQNAAKILQVFKQV